MDRMPRTSGKIHPRRVEEDQNDSSSDQSPDPDSSPDRDKSEFLNDFDYELDIDEEESPRKFSTMQFLSVSQIESEELQQENQNDESSQNYDNNSEETKESDDGPEDFRELLKEMKTENIPKARMEDDDTISVVSKRTGTTNYKSCVSTAQDDDNEPRRLLKMKELKRFPMSNWIELQQELKQFEDIVYADAKTTKALQTEIQKKAKEYYQQYLKDETFREKIRSQLDKVPIKDSEITKILFESKDIITKDVCDQAVRSLLLLLYKHPKIIAESILSTEGDLDTNEFEETLCSTFFTEVGDENDQGCNTGLFRLIKEMCELCFKGSISNPMKAFMHPKLQNFIGKVFKMRLFNEYKMSVLKVPIQEITNIKENLGIDKDEIEKQKKLVQFDIKEINKEKREDISKKLMVYNMNIKPEKQVDPQDDFTIRYAYKEIMKIAEYAKIFMKSILKQPEKIPVELKIIAAIILKTYEEQFTFTPEAQKKREIIQFILGNFFIPAIQNTDYLEKYSPRQEANLKWVSELFPTLFEFPEFELQMNDFYQVLTKVSSKILKASLSSKVQKIRLVSILISVEALQQAYRSVKRIQQQYNDTSLNTLLSRIDFYLSQQDIFVDQLNQVTKEKVPKKNSFMLYSEFLTPENINMKFMEKFDKVQDYDDKYSAEALNLIRLKHNIKTFLIKSKDIDSILKRMLDEDSVIFLDILEAYENKLVHKQHEASKKFEIQSKVILSLMQTVPKEYLNHNCRKLFLEISYDFQDLSTSIIESISQIKKEFLGTIRIIDEKYRSITQRCEHKIQSLHQTQFGQKIKKLNFDMCITTASLIEKLNPIQIATDNPAIPIPQKDELDFMSVIQQKCYHYDLRGFVQQHRENIGSNIDTLPSTLQEKAKVLDSFQIHDYHVQTVKDFVHIFGSLSEVDELINTQMKDEILESNLRKWIEHFLNIIKEDVMPKNMSQKKDSTLMEELLVLALDNVIFKPLIEKKLTDRAPSELDIKFQEQCLKYGWIQASQQQGSKIFMMEDIWKLAQDLFNDFLKQRTLNGILESLFAFGDLANQVLKMTTKGDDLTADILQDIIVYLLLKTQPKNICSTFNFIRLLMPNFGIEKNNDFFFQTFEMSIAYVLKLDDETIEKFTNTSNKKLVKKILTASQLKKLAQRKAEQKKNPTKLKAKR